mgnify:CR=1 FL=1
MKKILSIAAFMLLTISSAYAVDGRMGVTLKAGYFEADEASEIFSGAHSSGASPGTVTKKASGEGDVAEGEFAFGSIFAEVMVNEKFAVGIDYVPMSLESETTENTQTTTTSSDTGTNKVQVDFEDLTTVYASFFATDNIYLKVGYMEVDVKTNENLATGGNYGNTSLDGYTIGLGFNNDMDNGMFVRFEAAVIDLDGATLVNKNDANKKVTTDGIEGVTAALSLGRSF